ncbi:MAG: class B sortase [Lachnospiraceae bacterium]|jgi:sortase B|nr:class B sortase [Lachnospiraceae bacterium]
MKIEKKKVIPALMVIALGIAVSMVSFQAGEVSFPQEAEALQEEIAGIPVDEAKFTDESGEVRIDFEALEAQNPDIYAWITLPGTEIDYPVLQKSDSEDPYDNYYLNHTVDFTEGLPGAIYSQAVNHKDFMDPVTVLYGHNLKNGGMFTSLHRFEEQDFFEKNRQIILYTPEGTLIYEIFAAVEFSDDLIPYEYDFSDPLEVQRYLEDVGGCEGNFREDIAISQEDKILTLSTCYSGRDTSRLLVEAVMIEKEQIK